MTVRQNSLLLITASFFGWGLLRAMNDILVAAHQIQRPAHDAEAMLVHLSFFAAYLLLPIPASLLTRRFGLRWGLMGSSFFMGSGALLCSLDLHRSLEMPCLAYIFAIAAGIAILQTSGNPGITLLGAPQNGARRLLAAQSVLALGSAAGPFLVALRHAGAPDPLVMLSRARVIYLVAGAALVLLALIFALRSHDGLEVGRSSEQASGLTLRRPMVFALLAIFLFVGTEATVLTHILAYRRTFSAASLAFLGSGTLSVYWLIVMAGRLGSSWLLKRFDLVFLLRCSGFTGVALLMVAVLQSGSVGLVGLLLTGLVNATIFPLVFCLSTEGLAVRELATASGWLMTAMCGGAVIPMISGELADHWGFRAAFLMPMICYGWIGGSAAWCKRAPVRC